MLLELADELAVAPAGMLMIGDTTHDLDMAHAAGADSVGVTYGAHPRAQLAERAPRSLISTPQELRAWLQTNR
jgi:phosphoglycolate phosphatase